MALNGQENLVLSEAEFEAVRQLVEAKGGKQGDLAKLFGHTQSWASAALDKRGRGQLKGQLKTEDAAPFLYYIQAGPTPHVLWSVLAQAVDHGLGELVTDPAWIKHYDEELRQSREANELTLAAFRARPGCVRASPRARLSQRRAAEPTGGFARFRGEAGRRCNPRASRASPSR